VAMAAAELRHNTVTRHTQEVEAEMATMVATARIAVILGIVGRRPGSCVVPGKDRVAVVRPSRAESEDGQHQP
jgi:hypothetical protein